MKTFMLIIVAAALLCAGCERGSVDSQVRSDGPTGTVDDQDATKQNRADTAVQQADTARHTH